MSKSGDRGTDEHGEFVATVDAAGTVTYRWYLRCPRCGADRSGLLGVAHDFGSDCPRCRGPATGPTCHVGSRGPKDPPSLRPYTPTSARNLRRLARRKSS